MGSFPPLTPSKRQVPPTLSPPSKTPNLSHQTLHFVTPNCHSIRHTKQKKPQNGHTPPPSPKRHTNIVPTPYEASPINPQNRAQSHPQGISYHTDTKKAVDANLQPPESNHAHHRAHFKPQKSNRNPTNANASFYRASTHKQA